MQMINSMIFKKREQCVLCQGELEQVFTHKNFPVYMGVSENLEYQTDLCEDMVYTACVTCGCIQLQNLIDPNILYEKSHNPSVGKTWERHHEHFSKFVLKHTGEKVLELGGGNLKLCNKIVHSDKIKKYTIIDKHQYKKTNKKTEFVNKIFTLEDDSKFDCDTIVHSHTFEHLYFPIKYLNKFNNMLSFGQKMIFSVPNTKNLLADGMNNGINFEHTFLVSESNLKNALNKTGFEILEFINYSPYNFFVSCKKKQGIIKTEKIDELEENVNIFYNLVSANKIFCMKNRELLASKKEVFVFGAHINTQILLHSGLKEESVSAVLDNDPNKIGRRLYGSSLLVKSPEILKKYQNPTVVLKNGIYSKEIEKQLKTINSNIQIIC